jgi:ribose transport system permease protein
VLVSLFGRGTWLSGTNLSNMAVRSVALGIVAIGQTFTILVGSLDLSVAYLISVVAVMASYIMQGDPDKVPQAILIVFGIGLGVGLVNGLIITKLRLNAFIATVGTGLLMQGVLNASFENFAGAVPTSFQDFAYGKLGPFPAPVLLLLLIAALAAFVLERTRFGAHLYAVGGNRSTARLSGVRTDRVIIAAHVIASLMATISGLFIVSRLRAGAPWVGPDGAYDIESVAAVVVGGTALSGGRGGVGGTLAGVFIFSVLDTMFNQLGIDPYLKQVFRGLIIIAAVASYSVRSRETAA